MTSKSKSEDIYESLVAAVLDYRTRYKMPEDSPMTARLPDREYELLLRLDLVERALIEHRIHIRPDSFYEEVEEGNDTD